ILFCSHFYYSLHLRHLPSFPTRRSSDLYFLTLCATLALEGGPLFWVALHRQHHQHSDTDNDPHTPEHGGFWAHMGWIMFGDAMRSEEHTSELQSHLNLVCRLLLEKKNTN